MRRPFRSAASAALVLTAGLIGAAQPEIAAPAEKAGWFCAPGSRERADAAREFAALDAAMRALRPEDNPAVVNDALASMARHPCLALSRVAAGQLRAEASAALIDFWNNGGRSWIEDHFRVEEAEVLTFPPLLRKVMTPATRPGHPALALLCPVGDSRCGQETAGWWQRAESWFQLMASPNPRPRTNADPDDVMLIPFGRPVPNEASCRQEALATSTQRYGTWESCVQATRNAGFAMPLGRLKAPTTGWLVIRGRRGHYSYCDEVRMYSLASGAAYVSQGCSALFLGGNQRKVLQGSLSVENLREVVWMLLQLDEAAEGFQRWASFVIPAGIEPEPWRYTTGLPDNSWAGKKSRTVSSAQTTLAWTWTDPAGAALTSGTLMWPNDYARGGPVDHAIALLLVAEGGIQEGCAKDKPPENISLGAAKPLVSPVDASPGALSVTERELVAELNKAARGGCQLPR